MLNIPAGSLLFQICQFLYLEFHLQTKYKNNNVSADKASPEAKQEQQTEDGLEAQPIRRSRKPSSCYPEKANPILRPLQPDPGLRTGQERPIN
jgi:hypothetical protein